MNTFLTVVCLTLVATVAAKPIMTGYRYQKQNFVAPATQSFSTSPDLLAPPAPYVQQELAPPVQTPQYVASVPHYANSAPQYAASVQHHATYTHSAPAVQPTIVSKEIYIHAAPEETEVIGADQGPAGLAPIRKNYRVVFIKAPSHNLQLNLDALKRNQAANEEKTVIYVLSKKPDIGNIQSQLSALHTDLKGQKPEVHFIKYKTQEEAQRAQQEIQAQYDALGGTTVVSDEGIAPVASVIGSGAGSVGSSNFGGASVSAPSYTSNNFNSGNFGGLSAGGPDYATHSGSNFGSVDSGNFGSVSGNFGGVSGNFGGLSQQSFQSSQSSSSSVSFSSDATSSNYLPPALKK